MKSTQTAASILLIVAATICTPTLGTRAVSPPTRNKEQDLLLDCEHMIRSMERPDLTKHCFALIEAMLHLGPARNEHKTRRDARSPLPARPQPFASDALGLGMSQASSGDALGKLLTGLNEVSGGEEFSLLDAGDKPLWPGTMSEGIQSRWQPMRGKRQQPLKLDD